MEHKILSRHTDGAFRYQAWPTITRGSDGTLYVATSGHRLNHVCPFGKNLMYVSKDEGQTWSCPQIINDTYLDDRDAGLLAWGDGNLLLTYFSTPPQKFDETFDLEKDKPHVNVRSTLAMGMREIWAGLPEDQIRPGSWTRISRDNGKTWSAPRRAPVSSPHGPCRLQDGTLLFVGSIVEDGNFESADYVNRIQMFQSTDDGETWQFLSYIRMPEGADQGQHEPHAIQLANGDILVAVRYENTYTPVMKSLRVYTTISHDGGKTWEPSRFNDQHGAPPHLLQHSSGAVVMVFSRRLDPMGQYVQISKDFGKTWSEETMISPGEPTGTPAWDHGYPSSVELSNGDILTLYYQKCPGDDYCSLHTVRWSLDEVK